MRQITKQVVNAFLRGENKRVGNSEARGDELLLHGNVIARRVDGTLYATLANWPTPTTRERLNGLCDALNLPRFAQHRHRQYFGGAAIAADSWVELKRGEGVRVLDCCPEPVVDLDELLRSE